MLYQLLPDRFSDGHEGERAIFDFNDPGQFSAPDKAAWMAAGTRFNRGTIKAIANGLSQPAADDPRLHALFEASFAGAEFREGTRAFLEKRAPDFDADFDEDPE